MEILIWLVRSYNSPKDNNMWSGISGQMVSSEGTFTEERQFHMTRILRKSANFTN
jgi:hypothetical protein